MSGEFVYEDRGGNIILSSSPGVVGSTDSVKKSVKPKVADRKVYTRPTIFLFKELADVELDDSWKEVFLKMSESKFPSFKITWIPSIEDNGLYGEIAYRNRGTNVKKEIYKDDDITDIRNIIIDFISSYTNIGLGAAAITEGAGDSGNNDDIAIIDKSRISPISWKNLQPKDQSVLLDLFVKEFGLDNNLTKKEIENLSLKVIVFFIGKNISKINNYLKFDEEDGKILNILNLYKNSNGVYALKG